LDPEHGLARGFRSAWSHALGTDAEVPYADVYHALVEALRRDKDVPGGASAVVALRIVL
jgi:hypothetical protein